MLGISLLEIEFKTLSSFQSVQGTELSPDSNPLASGLIFEGIRVGCVLVFTAGENLSICWRESLEFWVWLEHIFEVDFKIFSAFRYWRWSHEGSWVFWVNTLFFKETNLRLSGFSSCLPVSLRRLQSLFSHLPGTEGWMSNPWIPCVELTSKPPFPCAETLGMV